MTEMAKFGSMVEKAEREPLESWRDKHLVIEVSKRNGRSVFHIFREVLLVCRRCRSEHTDPNISTCPSCGAAARELPGVLVPKPLYTGPWGRAVQNRLKAILEEVFRDGALEWIPELDSWCFIPTVTVLDHGLAAKTVLSKLLEPCVS